MRTVLDLKRGFIGARGHARNAACKQHLCLPDNLSDTSWDFLAPLWSQFFLFSLFQAGHLLRCSIRLCPRFHLIFGIIGIYWSWKRALMVIAQH